WPCRRRWWRSWRRPRPATPSSCTACADDDQLLLRSAVCRHVSPLVTRCCTGERARAVPEARLAVKTGGEAPIQRGSAELRGQTQRWITVRITDPGQCRQTPMAPALVQTRSDRLDAAVLPCGHQRALARVGDGDACPAETLQDTAVDFPLHAGSGLVHAAHLSGQGDHGAVD